MKILYVGSNGPLSTLPLKTLINSGINVCAVAYDDFFHVKTFSGISIVTNTSDSVESVAQLHNIPSIRFTSNYAQNIDEIKAFCPDMIIASCYPRKLPDSILSIPRFGCFNIHPSMLPAYRGPVPLFWQLRSAEKNLGVTLHRMTNKFDAGDIVKQKSVLLPDGVTQLEVSNTFAKAACGLLTECISDSDPDHFMQTPQNENLASYQTFPDAGDYVVNIQWSAQRMYNFICANNRPEIYFSCLVNDEIFQLSQALSFEATGSLQNPYLIKDKQILLNCSPGIIRCQLSTNPL